MKIKPCPYCGHEVYFEKNTRHYSEPPYPYILYHKTHIEGHCFMDTLAFSNSKKDTITLWNSRIFVKDYEETSLIELLRKEIDHRDGFIQCLIKELNNREETIINMRNDS